MPDGMAAASGNGVGVPNGIPVVVRKLLAVQVIVRSQ